MEEFEYLGVLFTSDERMEQEIDRWILAASAVDSVPVCRGEERAEPEGEALCLPVDLCSNPHLCHKLWVVTERMRLQIQATRN